MRVKSCWYLAALCANAAPAAEAPDTSLPEIVVTATRTERAAFDVPASIDAVAADDLDDVLGATTSEWLSGIAGVLARNRNNYAQDEQISIRGFGARSTFGVRGVRLYTDSIPATMPDGQGQVSHFNLDSAERIEVLRGPFSALYGNSSGGVIQLFSAGGSDPSQVELDLVGASWGTARASVNARGVEGDLDYNLDLTHFQTDGWRDHAGAERDSGQARIGWKVGDAGKLTVIANMLSLPGADDPLGLTHAQFDADPRSVAAVATQYDTRKRVEQNQLGAIWEQTLSDASSLRVLGYAGRRSVEQYLAIPPSAQANPKHSGGVVDLDSGYGGGDVRWIWKGELAGRPFELAAGVAADRQAQHRRGYENFVGDVLGVRGALRRDEDDRVDDFDQYAQATWDFADRWSLLAGARHSAVDFDSRDRYVTSGNPDDSGRTGYSATTPVVGLLWRVARGANAYVSYGRGFETPTFNELAYRADAAAGLAFDLDPARSRNAEIGIKLRPSAQVDAQFALFRADTRDELAVATSAGGRTTYQNIGRARRDGAEAALAWRFADRWSLRLAWTWLDATFRSAFLTCAGTPCTTPDTPVAVGARIPGIPKTDLHVALRRGAELGWHAGMQADYVGAVVVNDLGTDRAPAYVVASADAGYAFALASGRLDAFARIDNAFDRRYAGSVIVNDANGRYFEPGQGRSFMVGLKWRWVR